MGVEWWGNVMQGLILLGVTVVIQIVRSTKQDMAERDARHEALDKRVVKVEEWKSGHERGCDRRHDENREEHGKLWATIGNIQQHGGGR